MRHALALTFLFAASGCSSAEVTTTPLATDGGVDTRVATDTASDTKTAPDTYKPAEDTGEIEVDSAVTDAPPTCDATVCGGKCVDLTTDNDNCGACGKSCGSTGTCSAGSCTCASGTVTCAGSCVDLLNDAKNCGSCGRACLTGEVCKFASCERVCTAPAIKCFGECVDVSTSAMNCGACGRACGAGESCVSSACLCGTKTCAEHETCVAGTCTCAKTTCSGSCVDTTTSATHCGSCGNACSSGIPCIGGVCVASTALSFPRTTSTTYAAYSGTGTLGSGGSTSHFVTGDYVEDSYTRTAPVTRLDLSITMYDGTTTYCTVGTLSWAVKINGTTVGTYSFTGGTGGTDIPITQSYTFSAISPSSGQITIRLEATTTVCSGGSSWDWYPGGTATVY